MDSRSISNIAPILCTPNMASSETRTKSTETDSRSTLERINVDEVGISSKRLLSTVLIIESVDMRIVKQRGSSL